MNAFFTVQLPLSPPPLAPLSSALLLEILPLPFSHLDFSLSSLLDMESSKFLQQGIGRFTHVDPQGYGQEENAKSIK